MKNFVYISPNFPDNHWNFCRQLKDNGLNVLGIGDCPYDNLSNELKASLNEYYKVSTLENYDEVYRAIAYFIHKHGRIDWLESNNEYWLERDAQLREDFNITSGFHPADMERVKFKSQMKINYHKAHIATARYVLVNDLQKCLDFCHEVGYPVIVKPDNGVGAVGTAKLKNDADLQDFFERKDDTLYIMEEYIDGTVNSYDAIVNSKGEPIFETGNVTPVNLMEVVNTQDNCVLYIRNELPDDLRKKGRAALKAFNVKSRMVHFEFFRLNTDQAIGKKDQVVALEVNMRPSGGVSPTMMNYAQGTDVYKIWADMIAFDHSEKPIYHRQYCVFVGRRDHRHYVMSGEEIRQKYGSHLREEGKVDDALATDMGNYMYMATFDTLDEVNEYIASTLKEI